MTIAEVKAHKGIAEREDLNDRMGRRELSANIFVRSLTTDKIANEGIQGTNAIASAHHEVGSETRDLITRLGGTRPEDLTAEPTIRPLLDQQARHRKPTAEVASSATVRQPTLLESPTGNQ
ncbi:MAG TPA: hypothetical protein VIG30_12320 [Ktedonobacterales bacterium]|jgi:hypothetical protein